MKLASDTRFFRLLYFLATCCLFVFLTGCGAYSEIVRQRCRAWEAKQSWGADGVRRGCEPLEIGGGSTALLMVHGFGDNPSVWKPMMAGFAARGYFCRAMRLPGFGDTLEARKNVASSSWAWAIEREIQTLRENHHKVWLVAHSLGSAISIRQALNHQKSVDGLILLAPLFEVSTKRSPLLSARSWHRIFAHSVPVSETPFPEDLLKMPPADRAAVDLFITPNINDSLFSLLDEIRPRAGDIRVPVFLAISPHDHVADPLAARAWFAKMDNSPRRKQFFAWHSAHVLPLDFDADRLVSEIDRFIRSSHR